MSNSESLDRLALPQGTSRQEQAAATTQAGIFALDVALSIVEAPSKVSAAAAGRPGLDQGLRRRRGPRRGWGRGAPPP
ncbi:MAG: hypothetical protein QF521_19570, partial [Alphaproteobacteria bacterium]|nr:hypothetical protein [Alphaproteobacteria bacterium]